jgi:hypothetical protein
MSFQLSGALNWLPIHCDNASRLSAPRICPARLPSVRQSQWQRRGFAQDRRARAAISDIDQDALAQLDAFEVGAIGRKSLLGVGAALNEIEERAGHLAGGNMPQVLDAGHTFHGQAIIATCAGL